MMPSNRRSRSKLSDRDHEKIESEVKRAAMDHLHAPDAVRALAAFTDDAVLVSNARWYSRVEWAEVAAQFYGTLQEVHAADWEEMRVDVVTADAALVTAKFRWSSTDAAGVTIDLRGVWTALFALENQEWKIRVRHESFESADS